MNIDLAQWLPGALTAVCTVLFYAMLRRQEVRDARVVALEAEVKQFQLQASREFFSASQADRLIVKLDKVIDELNKQNITLARVETELKSHRSTQGSVLHEPQ